MKWSGKGNFVCGKGYQPGGPRYLLIYSLKAARHLGVGFSHDLVAPANMIFLSRNISYSGTFTPTGNAYLSIYGWTTNPLVEFYIIESYGTHKPCSDAADAEHKGNMTSDGGEYEIWTKMRRNKPSIQGTATFPQFWSIRTVKRVGGVVNTANHFKAWEAAGLKLGRHNYEIVATEGQDSEGVATITVGVAPTQAPTPAAAVPPSSEASSQSTSAPAATPTGKTSKNKHSIVPSHEVVG